MWNLFQTQGNLHFHNRNCFLWQKMQFMLAEAHREAPCRLKLKENPPNNLGGVWKNADGCKDQVFDLNFFYTVSWEKEEIDISLQHSRKWNSVLGKKNSFSHQVTFLKRPIQLSTSINNATVKNSSRGGISFLSFRKRDRLQHIVTK